MKRIGFQRLFHFLWRQGTKIKHRHVLVSEVCASLQVALLAFGMAVLCERLFQADCATNHAGPNDLSGNPSLGVPCVAHLNQSVWSPVSIWLWVAKPFWDPILGDW